MHVNVEDLSSVKKVLNIEIPWEVVRQRLDDEYNNLRKTVKIKGFRQGKAPKSVLVGMYKKTVNNEVRGALVQESFEEAVEKEGFRVLKSNNVDMPEIEENKVFKYGIEVEVAPELPNLEIRGLQLEKKKYTARDEEIDAQLKTLQTRYPKYLKIDEERPVQNGDIAVIDFEAFKDGKPLPEAGKAESHQMKVGAGSIDKSFDDQLIGMEIGQEKKITVTFPENIGVEVLAGAEVEYAVKLEEIRKEELLDINDDFAKMFGPFENLDALKEDIRNNLQIGYDKRTEQELSEQVFKALLAQYEFEIPESLVEMEINGIISEAEMTLWSKNMTLEQAGLSREILAEKYRDTAVEQAKRLLLLTKIIEQENLTLADAELEESYRKMALAQQTSLESIKDHFAKNPRQLENFKHSLLEKKAMELILKSSDITEVEAEIEKETETENQ